MNLPRKPNHIPSLNTRSHGCCSLLCCPSQQEQYATSRRGTRASRFVSGSHYRMTIPHFCGVDNWTVRSCLFRNGTLVHCAVRFARGSSARGCGFSLRVRQSVVCVALRGGASWRANQSCGSGRRRVGTLEQLFFDNRCRQIHRNSGASSALSGPTSRRSTWLSARGSRSVARNTSSTASASRTHAPCSRSMPRSSIELKLPCGVRAGAPAEINVRSFPSPMQGGRTWDQPRGLTNGDSLVLQPRLTGRGSCDSGALHSSSGRGLGIHQPGSNTRGFAIAHQPPSGRARDRAMCPAAARSLSVSCA